MNIAISARMLRKDPDDGISWFTYETVRRLINNNKQHTIYLIFDREIDKSLLFSANTRAVKIGPATRHPILWYWWLEYRLPKVLEEVKADLFIAPDGFISLRSKVPSIPVIHDINFIHRPGDLPILHRLYYRWFTGRFARKAIRIATVSEFSKNDISKSLGIDLAKIDVVYNGVSDAFSPAGEDEVTGLRKQLTKGQPFFLFVGNFSPRKNIPNLVRAYNYFRTISLYRHKLVLTGERLYLNNELDTTLRESPFADDIIFTGHKTREELRVLYSASEAFVFVPWFEGFGIPALEAMRCGTPVILSETTSLPEIGANAAVYVNPSDIIKISESMITIIEAKKKNESLKLLAFQHSMKFTWEKSAESLSDCIEKSLSMIKDQ